MKKIIISLLTINLLFFAVGCEKKQGAQTITEKDIAFTMIEQGAYSGLTQARNYTFYIDEEWQIFWQLLKINQLSAPTAPSMDFSQEMVIAASMGEKNTGGYKIEIEKIMETDKINVYLKTTAPDPKGITTQALTQPYVIAKIPLTHKEINFIEQ